MTYCRGARVGFVLATIGTLSVAGCAPVAATAQGASIRDAYTVFLIVGLGMAMLIWGLVTWSILRYRRRRSEPPRQTRDNLPFEIAWTVGPIVLVIALFILTFRTQISVDAQSPHPAVSVAVTAFTWQWQFQYEGTPVTIVGSTGDPPVMVVPVNETIHVDLVSVDVDHSFYVPQFLFKRDAIPGRTTSFDFKAIEPGLYPGQCAEFCGVQHAYMTFSVRAVDRPTFDAWLSAGGTTPVSGSSAPGSSAPGSSAPGSSAPGSLAP